MKKTLLLAISALFALTSASCSKDASDPTPEPAPTPEPEYQTGCTHGSLVFVPAREATETECGCLEHYYCPQCSKYFPDAGCKTEIESPVVWGTSFVFGTQDYYDFFDEAWEEYGFRDLVNTGSESNFFLGILSAIIVHTAKNALDKLSGLNDSKNYEAFMKIADNLSKIENATVGLSQMFRDEKTRCRSLWGIFPVYVN